MDWQILQDPSYHLFADSRALLGLPNAADTLSNLGFLGVGLLGLSFLAGQRSRGGPLRFADIDESRAYWALFSAIALTGLGSAWYHVAPDDARLVWDRLPMALGFGSILSITIAERVQLKLGLRLLLPLLLAGAGSVAWWSATGNLLPYLLVQYGSLAAVFAIVMARRSRYTHGSYIFGVLAFYAAAKAAESLDARIYAWSGLFSGHTLKHLLAAAAVFWLLRMLQRRSPQ